VNGIDWGTVLLEFFSNPVIAFVIGGVAVFVVDLALRPWWSRRDEARRKHKRRVLALLDQEFDTVQPLQYRGTGIMQPPLKLARPRWVLGDPAAERLLTHLNHKNYGSITESLEKAMRSADEDATAVERRVEDFEQYALSHIATVSDLPDWNGYTNVPPGGLDRMVFLENLFLDTSTVLDSKWNKPEPIAETDSLESGYESTVQWRNRRIAVGPRPEMRKIKATVEELRENRELIDLVVAIRSAQATRSANPARKRFEDERKAIVERLEIRMEDLQGRCLLCPPLTGVLPP
jgi:hypothetical protein